MPPIIYIGMDPLPDEPDLYDTFLTDDKGRLNIKRRALLPVSKHFNRDLLQVREFSITVSSKGRDVTHKEMVQVMRFLRKNGIRGIVSYEPGEILERGHCQCLMVLYTTSYQVVRSHLKKHLRDTLGKSHEKHCANMSNTANLMIEKFTVLVLTFIYFLGAVHQDYRLQG